MPCVTLPFTSCGEEKWLSPWEFTGRCKSLSENVIHRRTKTPNIEWILVRRAAWLPQVIDLAVQKTITLVGTRRKGEVLSNWPKHIDTYISFTFNSKPQRARCCKKAIEIELSKEVRILSACTLYQFKFLGWERTPLHLDWEQAHFSFPLFYKSKKEMESRREKNRRILVLSWTSSPRVILHEFFGCILHAETITGIILLGETCSCGLQQSFWSYLAWNETFPVSKWGHVKTVFTM